MALLGLRGIISNTYVIEKDFAEMVDLFVRTYVCAEVWWAFFAWILLIL